MLKAYADVNLTTLVPDLNKVKKDTTIYILIPKPRAENTKLDGVTGADKVADTVATVKMTGNKTISATYTLDTANFKYTLNKSSCNVWGYTGTAKNIEIPAIIQGLPVDTISSDINDNSAFQSVQSVIISYGVKIINANAFKSCYNLEKITIPNSVISIELQSFLRCSKLKNLIIPSSVQNISPFAFGSCSALDKVRVEALSPPILLTTDPNIGVYVEIFGDASLPLTISVPPSALANYQKEWTEDKLIINFITRNKSRPSVTITTY